MRGKNLLFLITFVLYSLCSCYHSSPSKVVIAIVNGHELYARDLIKVFTISMGESLEGEMRKLALSGDNELHAKLKLQILSYLIEEELMIQEAKKRGIKVSPEEVKSEINNMFSKYPGGFTSFTIAHPGIFLTDIEDRVKRGIYIKKLVNQITQNIKVTEKEIKDYYEKHREDFFRPEMVHARQIVVKDVALARNILQMLRKPGGKEKFPELARKFSLAPEAEKGGDLGYFSEEEMPPEFSVCFSMKKGEVSKIVHSPYGYHIFLVEDTLPAIEKSLEEVHGQIMKTLEERKKQEYLSNVISELKKKANIIVYEDRIADVSLF